LVSLPYWVLLSTTINLKLQLMTTSLQHDSNRTNSVNVPIAVEFREEMGAPVMAG